MLSSQVIDFIQHQFKGFGRRKLIIIFFFLLRKVISGQSPENKEGFHIMSVKMFSGHLSGFHQLKLFGARRRLIWEILLSPWMTGSKRIKYNFESSRNPRLSHLSFDAYSASILLLASTKCPYFSRKSMPFCVWTAIWSYWSWNWFILVKRWSSWNFYPITQSSRIYCISQ